MAYEGFALAVDGRAVLAPLSLELEGPGVVALLGPSGVGKSSLLRATQRLLLRPGDGWTRRGDVRLDGESVFGMANVARRIGYVHQRPRMLAHSVLDNVAFALRHTTRLSRSLARKRAAEVLDQVGLGDELDGYDLPAWCLSGGQAQRLAVARSMALEPAVLLLDEPCSSLDPLSSARMEALVRNVASRCLVVLVTHDAGLASRLSERIGLLMPGESGARLVSFGPTETLLRRPTDRELREFLRPDVLVSETLVSPVASRRFLFVCGGNTSRSPLAEVICDEEVARAVLLRGAAATVRDVEASSAGLSAREGAALEPSAEEALRRLGYPPREHRSRPVSAELTSSAARIFCMTSDQCVRVAERFPDVGPKVERLDPVADIANPHGGDQDTYDGVAARIRDAVRYHLEQT